MWLELKKLSEKKLIINEIIEINKDTKTKTKGI